MRSGRAALPVLVARRHGTTHGLAALAFAVCSGFGLLASAAHAAGPQAAPRGALLLMQVPDGAEPRVRKALGARVLDAATTKKIEADAASVGLGCATLTDACAAGFGQVSGVDEVVVVTVQARGGGRLVRAARVDARTSRVVDVTVGRLAEVEGDGGVDVEVVAGNLYAKAKTPAPVPVAVVVDPPGTPVHIDGRPAALHDGDAWLLPGAHELAVEGAAAAITKIVVTDRGEPDRVELTVIAQRSPARDVEPPPVAVTPADTPPSLPAALTWTGVGVGVGGAALALCAEVWLANEQSNKDLQAAEGQVAGRVGQAGLGVVVVGVVIAGVGAGLWWSSP